jgi:hypothetical protein
MWHVKTDNNGIGICGSLAQCYQNIGWKEILKNKNIELIFWLLVFCQSLPLPIYYPWDSATSLLLYFKFWAIKLCILHLFPIVLCLDIRIRIINICNSPTVKGTCKQTQFIAFMDQHVETFGLMVILNIM